MRTLVCIYCEGSDTKIAALSKEKETFRLLKVGDFDLLQSQVPTAQSFAAISFDGGIDSISMNDLDKPLGTEVLSVSNEHLLNNALSGLKLSNCEFIPAITEPALHYHLYEGSKEHSASKLSQEIIDEIQKTKNIIVAKDTLGYTELAGGQLLSVFADGEIGCINLINSLAHFNNKRYYKIPAVKSADISLAHYVAQKKKFFPDDFSLIVYIGKEYSKLIFLQGKKLKHIGSTLDVGTINLHTYDVYFSKILLEMENGGVPRIDNVVLCGEDDSENLILSFYGTFPEANVSKLEFEDIDTSQLTETEKEKISSFTVPLAVGFEYFEELEKKHAGINLLPQYVKEDQKFLQFGWHSFAILPVLFAITIFFTIQIQKNSRTINKLDTEINQLVSDQEKNRLILEDINKSQTRVDNFGATLAILDSASVGSGLWSRMTKEISDFIGARGGMWITSMASDGKNTVTLNGYGMTRNVLTDFARTNDALLKSVIFESLRNKSAYKSVLTFDISKYEEKYK